MCDNLVICYDLIMASAENIIQSLGDIYKPDYSQALLFTQDTDPIERYFTVIKMK